VKKAGTTRAFTLIELMVVVAIMGIVLGMGIPSVVRMLHREPLTQAMLDVQEVCSHARARAILQGVMTEVIFHPRDGRVDFSGPGAPAPARSGVDFDTDRPAKPSDGLSAQFSDRLTIEMLDINLTEYKDAEIARVRFYPNGMCDELTLILHSDNGEFRKLSLEITTGLATIGAVDR
jgi:prepilin-type N-terminal cleavage/methylation domain-containing protein